MSIRHVVPSDYPEWLRLRNLLWPGAPDYHERELAEFFTKPSPDLATFVIDCGGTRLGGFLEAQVRNYAEGCSGSRIGYIEGWYVEPELRRQGWAATCTSRRVLGRGSLVSLRWPVTARSTMP